MPLKINYFLRGQLLQRLGFRGISISSSSSSNSLQKGIRKGTFRPFLDMAKTCIVVNWAWETGDFLRIIQASRGITPSEFGGPSPLGLVTVGVQSGECVSR